MGQVNSAGLDRLLTAEDGSEALSRAHGDTPQCTMFTRDQHDARMAQRAFFPGPARTASLAVAYMRRGAHMRGGTFLPEGHAVMMRAAARDRGVDCGMSQPIQGELPPLSASTVFFFTRSTGSHRSIAHR